MKAGVFFLIFFSSLMVVLVVLAPVLEAWGQDNAGAFLRISFSDLCHQLHHRSFHILGHPMAVCARDFGIYAGMLIGSLAVLFWGDQLKELPAWLILVATVPIALDGGTQFIGLRESSNILRLLTGLIFSIPLPFYLAKPIDEIYSGLGRYLTL